MLQSYFIAMFHATSAVDINVQEVNSKHHMTIILLATKNITQHFLIDEEFNKCTIKSEDAYKLVMAFSLLQTFSSVSNIRICSFRRFIPNCREMKRISYIY